jgi:hypothetical protein
VIKVDGLVLVSRRSDGKIHVDDDFHTAAEARPGARSRGDGHQARGRPGQRGAGRDRCQRATFLGPSWSAEKAFNI